MNPLEQIAGRILMEWDAPEYNHYEKGVNWYWWAGLTAILLLGLAVWQKSFLFGTLILVGWFTVVVYAARPPRTVKFAITENGILVENRLYPWNELQSFWVFNNPPLLREISLASQRALMPYIKIPLADGMDIDRVKDAMKKFLQEKEQQESLIDNLTHLAKF